MTDGNITLIAQAQTSQQIIFYRFSKAAGLFVMAVSGLVMVGWIFEIRWLTSVSPAWASMKANTAMCFLLSGLSLVLLNDAHSEGRMRTLGRACAAIIVLAALLTMGEYTFDRDLGIDELLLQDFLAPPGTNNLGRMSPVTAFNFVLIGLALLALDWKTRLGHRPAQALPLLVGFIGLLAAVGYLYGVKSLYAFMPFSSVALHTALLFIALALGVLSARSDQGPLSTFTGEGVGSSLARRLLPCAVAAPLFLGWLRLLGEQAGLYSFEFGLALFAISNVFVFSFLIWRTSIWLNRTDAERKRTSAILVAAEQEKQLAFDVIRMKSEFLANMSHELRTPLNAIIGFSELMHDGKIGAMPAQQKEFMGHVLSSARHLLQLINDVLDLAKVESGKMEFHPEPLELPELVNEVHNVVRALVARKRLKVSIEIDPDITDLTLDPGKLKQVLYNYLSNAIKFTPDEGGITVRAIPEGENEFRLEVRDTGIGIKPEDQRRLFVEFEQLDNSLSKKYQGTGLGLVLTRRIVEAQGGRIGATSEIGKGSIFYAVLPRRSEGGKLGAPMTHPDAPISAGGSNSPVPGLIVGAARQSSAA